MGGYKKTTGFKNRAALFPFCFEDWADLIKFSDVKTGEIKTSLTTPASLKL